MKFNIAIDGPSGSGKSVIAKKIAQKHQFKHIDSGAMYRCVAFEAMRQNIDLGNQEALCELIHSMSILFTPDSKVLINNEDVTLDIRQEAVSIAASNVSKHKEVRVLLVKAQQEMAKEKNCIMEGRDIGSVVLPDAKLKIFLTADVKVRAKRRYLDLLSKNIEANYEQVEKDLILRDYQDTHRKESPLEKMDDAIEINSTYLSLEETIDIISSHIIRLKGESND